MGGEGLEQEEFEEKIRGNKREIMVGSLMVPPSIGGIRVNIVGIRV